MLQRWLKERLWLTSARVSKVSTWAAHSRGCGWVFTRVVLLLYFGFEFGGLEI
jgi:hypothetical protein